MVDQYWKTPKQTRLLKQGKEIKKQIWQGWSTEPMVEITSLLEYGGRGRPGSEREDSEL